MDKQVVMKIIPPWQRLVKLHRGKGGLEAYKYTRKNGWSLTLLREIILKYRIRIFYIDTTKAMLSDKEYKVCRLVKLYTEH